MHQNCHCGTCPADTGRNALGVSSQQEQVDARRMRSLRCACLADTLIGRAFVAVKMTWRLVVDPRCESSGIIVSSPHRRALGRAD
jgi:hypothetical protein